MKSFPLASLEEHPVLGVPQKDGHESARVGIGVAVLAPRGYVFLRRQGAHGEGQWSFPGGGLEKGERIGACAIRECAEEIGVAIEDVRLIPCLTEDAFPEDGQHWITLYVLAKTNQMPRIMEPDKADEIGFFWPSQMPEPLFPGIAELMAASLLPTEYD